MSIHIDPETDDLTLWIGQGKKWDAIPLPIQLAGRLAFAIPPIVKATLLPSANLSIKSLTDFGLPPTQKHHNDLSIDPAKFYSDNEPAMMSNSILMYLQRLPIPEESTIVTIIEQSLQLWLDGAKSVCYAHYNSDLETTHFPLWAITFWKEATHIKIIAHHWIKCKDWVMEQLRQKKSEEQYILAEEAMVNLAALPWNLPKPKGLSDSGPIHSIWRFLGPHWLSCSNQNDLLEVLRDKLLDNINPKARKMRIEGSRLTEKIIEAYRQQETGVYWKDSSFKWLWMVAECLRDRQQTLITVINLTLLTGNQHWVPFIITPSQSPDTGIPSLFYGDSLGHPIPEELCAAYTWWLDVHWPKTTSLEEFVDKKRKVTVPEISALPISTQTDGHSCGILADNALRNFVDPLAYPLCRSKQGDIIEYRLEVFNAVSQSIILVLWAIALHGVYSSMSFLYLSLR